MSVLKGLILCCAAYRLLCGRLSLGGESGTVNLISSHYQHSPWYTREAHGMTPLDFLVQHGAVAGSCPRHGAARSGWISSCPMGADAFSSPIMRTF